MLFSSSPSVHTSSLIDTKDGTQLYVKDWGKGPIVLFLHGYPLSSDAWEDHMFTLSRNGYRTVAYDRRGFGRSSQSDHGYDYDTFASDLDSVIKSLQLDEKITLVGHSMGGGEIARYIAKYGEKRIVKIAFISAVTPYLLQTDEHSLGVPKSLFDSFRSSVLACRSKWNFEVATLYYAVKTELKEESSTLKGLQDEYWRQGQNTSLPAAYHSIAAFSETDFRKDLAKITVPTLIIHGDNDQIVPFNLSAKLTAELVPHAKLIVYEGGSHGLIHQEKEKLSRDLMDFIKQ